MWQWSIAMFKSGWDAVMGVRSLFRELKEKRDAMEDEEKVPQVIQCMDETEQIYTRMCPFSTMKNGGLRPCRVFLANSSVKPCKRDRKRERE